MFIKKTGITIVLLVGLLCGDRAMAAFTLNGTRFIYPQGEKNISLEVSNETARLYGGQVWIDNDSQPATDVIMLPSPTFFKIAGGQKQVVRIMDINDSLLPEDRESLFRLNVQEIPPAPDNPGSILAIAMNTRVKLIYRPKPLITGRDGAESRIRIVTRGKQSVLINPTPYYLAIVAIRRGRDAKSPPLMFSHTVSSALGTLAPYAEIALGHTVNLPVTLQAVDDYGAVRDYHPGTGDRR
ncbi:fimbrial chaperone [Salmonella enterica]